MWRQRITILTTDDFTACGMSDIYPHCCNKRSSIVICTLIAIFVLPLLLNSMIGQLSVRDADNNLPPYSAFHHIRLDLLPSIFISFFVQDTLHYILHNYPYPVLVRQPRNLLQQLALLMKNNICIPRPKEIPINMPP